MGPTDGHHPDPRLLHRIRDEYLDLPGLNLTPRQAQRLWSLDENTCREAMSELVREGFLHRTGGGLFTRADDADLLG